MPAGPWLTPPQQTATVNYTADPATPYHYWIASSGASFAAVCEDAAPGEGTQNTPDFQPGYLWVVVASDGSLSWEIRHRPLDFDAASIVVGAAVQYVPPLTPPHATALEYEIPTPTLAQRAGWIDSTTAAWTLHANSHLGGVDGERLYPAALTAELRASTGDTEEFLTGSGLAAKTLVWSGAVPAVLDDALTESTSIDLAALALAGVRTFWLTYAEQISHDSSGLPVPSPAVDETRVGGGRIDLTTTGGGPRVFVLDVAWTPGRYRWIYDVLPPLRQFPRDDFLGGAPRQGKESTSVQASPRQGWTGTYR